MNNNTNNLKHRPSRRNRTRIQSAAAAARRIPSFERLEGRALMSGEPSEFLAVGASTSSINLTWTDNCSTETHFILERSTGGPKFKRIASLPADTTSFSDSGLAAGANYQYRIKAITSGSGNSGWTRTSGSTLAVVAPAAPSGLVATGSSASSIALTWTDNANSETHFLVERCSDGLTYKRIASLAADTTTFIDTGLTAGTHRYRVKAVNASASSKWVYVNGTTTTPVAPAAPTGFTATANSTSELGLSWTDNATNETHFIVDRSTDGVTFKRIKSLPADSTGFVDSDLEPGTKYYYNLKAVSDGATSKWVRTNGTTETPPEPEYIIDEDFGGGSGNFNVVDGSWGVVGGAYVVIAVGSDATALNTRSIHATELEGDFTLDVDASVTAGATAWNDFAVIFGYKDSSNYYFFSSNQTNDSGTSGIFKVVDGVSTELADAGSIASGTTYQVRVVRTGEKIDAYRGGVLVATVNDSTFMTGQIGLGTKSDIATFDNLKVVGAEVAPPTTPPADPSDLNATASGSTAVNLTWADNSSDEASFKVERSTDGGETWTLIATRAPDTTSYTVGGLSPETTYHFRVRAYNVAGYSGYTDTASATTEAGPAVPTAPSSLTANTTGASTINLTWSDNSSDELSFKVERSTDGGNTWTLIATRDPNTTSYTVGGLSASTTYHFRVRAFNDAGYSGYSNVASDITEAQPPPSDGDTLGSYTKPSPANTGLTNPNILTPFPTGVDFFTSSHGQVIENMDFNDTCIHIQHNNVIIRNCRIRNIATAFWKPAGVPNLTGVRVENCYVEWTGGDAGVHTGISLYYNHFKNMWHGDFWQNPGNCEWIGNYFDCTGHIPVGPHADVVQFYNPTFSEANWTVRGNYFQANNGYTSIVLNPSATKVIFENNWVEGGSYAVQTIGGGGSSVSGNLFLGGWSYGPVRYFGSQGDMAVNLKFEQNSILDNGVIEPFDRPGTPGGQNMNRISFTG